MPEILLIGFVIGALTASAYASFRFTALDPQMPIARSRWLDLAYALGAALFLAATTLKIGLQWKELLAYVSIALVISPAILPPYNLTRSEEPSALLRFARSKVATFVGGKLKALALLLVGAWAGLLLQLLPEPRPPLWFVALGTAALISILTRPLSIRLQTGAVKPVKEISPELASALRSKRGIAAGAIILWLCLALPLMESSYYDEFNVAAFLVAIILGMLLS